MQKGLRINTQVRKQFVKKARSARHRTERQEWKDYLNNAQGHRAAVSQYIKEERANRKEDWKLGPLAPNRDAGKHRGLLATIDVAFANLPAVPKYADNGPKHPGSTYIDYGAEESKKFKGRTLVGNILIGDRVCIVKGDPKIRGLVGYVKDVEEDTESVRITNVYMGDIKMPSATMVGNITGNKISTMELPIPIADVRLVATIEDPDGKSKNVLVNHVHADGPYSQQREGSNHPAHTRYITGTKHLSGNDRDLVLDWPTETVEEDEKKGAGTDTGMQEVKERTWIPSVDLPPLGYGVLSDDAELAQLLQNPINQYTLGSLNDKPRDEQTNTERAGMHGFLNYERFQERRKRVARGIMYELQPKYARVRKFDDSVEYATRKLMEDARSHWFESRTLATPAQEALLRQQREKAARFQKASSTASVKVIPAGGDAESVETEPAQTPRVAWPKTLSLRPNFVMDEKLKKQLKALKVEEIKNITLQTPTRSDLPQLQAL